MQKKRGQISFEYMVLFSLTLLVFIVVGTIVAEGIQRVNASERDAGKLADKIKIEVITASLSSMDYESSFELPLKVGKFDYVIEVYESDDILLIKTGEGDDVKQIGKAYLPILDNGDGIDDITILNSGDTILISKVDGRISITEGVSA